MIINLTIAILLLPFRFVFAWVVFLLTGLVGVVIATTNTIKDKDFSHFADYYKVQKESFLDALMFPFWPIVKMFNR